ncbi:MAG: 16S rRNA (cytosine(967)-C(5))-methyltransferase RsmB [Oscillospiraceae bacterium]|nr:16S rRNA (cytosine(967)-C(5))-methyltransferase RsmB [Oscillospiraceae bacterium]
MTARLTAAGLLVRTLRDGSYSHLALDSALSASGLSAQDRALCTQLYYGVIRRMLTLRHIVSCYSKRPPERLDVQVLCILYLGLYQLLYCDGIPDRAAVHESVALTRDMHKGSAAGFVNAVLRSFLRDDKRIRLPQDETAAMSVRWSVPEALVRVLLAEKGPDFTEAFLADALKVPPCTVRRNPLRCPPQALEALGAAPCRRVEGAYLLPVQDPAGTPEFRQGFYHVQDTASQLCCAVLDPQPGETVLDMCAAPGGKTFTIAERMEDRGQVYAFDLHEKRVRLIEEGAARLGLACIRAGVQDASVYRADLPLADRVLCDVPCSGLGVIRRKPEIRYKPLESFARLPEVQRGILETACRYVRPGGTLVYSTCTVVRSENEAVVEDFLAAHPEFEPEMLTELGIDAAWHTFSPAEDCDGFFAARMRRKAGAS